MRAIQIEQFGDPAQVLRVVDVEEPPPPGPHEVLVSVEVSPLNKHDLLVVTGVLARPPLPHIPGAEGVARVLATGAEVDGLQVGDLVVLPLYAGAWRERLVVPADSLFALRAGGNVEQYSMLGSNPPTAGLMLSECTPLQPGDWVVQNAANSGVGRSLIALAKLRGLKTINLARDDATFAEARQQPGPTWSTSMTPTRSAMFAQDRRRAEWRWPVRSRRSVQGWRDYSNCSPIGGWLVS